MNLQSKYTKLLSVLENTVVLVTYFPTLWVIKKLIQNPIYHFGPLHMVNLNKIKPLSQ